jgi:hypothetical protein
MSTLLDLIQADAQLVAKAEAGDCIGVADALNARTIDVQAPYQLTTLKVLDVLGPIRGTAVMKAIRGLDSFSEIVPLMDQVAAGVNLNHADADAMFAQLVTASILTQPEADQILALRAAKTSKAEQSLGRTVSHLDVAAAWAGRS